MNDPTIQDARASPREIPVPSNYVYCSSKFPSSNSQPQDNECYISNRLEGNCIFLLFMVEFTIGNIFCSVTIKCGVYLSDFAYTHTSISFYLIFSLLNLLTRVCPSGTRGLVYRARPIKEVENYKDSTS
jgi:hypothetical protein